MPRRPRVHLDGLPLHIVQRGHNRQPCFFCEADYQRYLHWLEEALAQARCERHAYVLMTNHVHLLVTPQEAQRVPGVLISLGRRYVQHVNRVYRRTGTLWDSRYTSSLVQSGRHLLACQRYIELNPVRAGMVADPADYAWSSYRHNGLGEINDRLTPHPDYLELGVEPRERQAAYRALFDGHLDRAALDHIRLALNQGQPTGDSQFHAAIEAALGRRCEARPRGRPRATGN